MLDCEASGAPAGALHLSDSYLDTCAAAMLLGMQAALWVCLLV
jgi:hypothetical protein